MERDILNTIMQYLWYNKIMAWRNNTTGVYDPTKKIFRKMPKYTRKGVPDIIGIYKGRFLGIEVKQPGKYPSKEQREFIAEAQENGGIAFVARSLEDVKEFLSKYK